MRDPDELLDAAIDAELDTGTREPSRAAARASVVRRVGRLCAGGILLVAGLALMVLPGPGLVVVVAALALLARDIPWAARTLERVQSRADAVTGGRSRHLTIGAGAVSLGVAAISLALMFG